MIIAILGLPGSGKTETTDYIKIVTGWPSLYYPKIVFDKLKEEGKPFTEDNERKMREALRDQFGIAAMAIVNKSKVREMYDKGTFLIESMYSWEEYLLVKEEYGDEFKAISVLSSPDIRSNRLKIRPNRPLTREEFVSRDYSQIENLHQGGPIARGDYFIINEFDLPHLHQSIDVILSDLERFSPRSGST